MVGNISDYDDVMGMGKVQPKEGNHEHDFSVEAWFYSANLPEIGMEVEFMLEAGSVSYITEKTELSLIEKIRKQEEEEKIAGEEEKEQEEFVVEGESPYADLGVDSIDLKYSIEECINKYFDRYLQKVRESMNLLERERTMDYFLMRRFFVTAYNNIVNLDSRVAGNKRINEILEEFQNVEKMYRTLVKYSKMDSRYVYEKIFLTFQPDYVKVLKVRQSQQKQLENAIKIESGLKEQIAKTEKKLKEGEGEKEELEGKIKHHRTQHADTVQTISDCRKKIDFLNEMLAEFEERFSDDFLEINKNFTRDLGERLTKILDVLSYEFDYLLWDLAKNSVVVRQKFAEANVEGTYCSKTFLKYYLKNLDETKLSDYNASLIKLAEKLEKEYSKKFAVCCFDAHYAHKLKQSLEFMNKDYDFRYFGSPKEVLNWVVKHKADGIVMTLQLRQATALDLIRSVKKFSKDGFIDFYVIYRPVEEPHVRRLKTHGVKYLFREENAEGGFDVMLEELAQYI